MLQKRWKKYIRNIISYNIIFSGLGVSLKKIKKGIDIIRGVDYFIVAMRE